MNKSILELSAYHEAGHIVFAYLNGFSATKSQLSEFSADGGTTHFDGGNDNVLIQNIFTKGYTGVPSESRDKSIELAMKLISVYCAGSCTEIYYELGKNFPEESIEVSGADAKAIQSLQDFLKTADGNFPNDYPARVIKIIFDKLRDEKVCAAIEELAQIALKEESHSLNRFHIEDGLVASGFKSMAEVVRQPGGNLGINLQDKNMPDEKYEKHAPRYIPESPLDILLKDILEKIKKDWEAGELEQACDDIKRIFDKYSR